MDTQVRDARVCPSTATTYATQTGGGPPHTTECSRHHSVTHVPQAWVTPTVTDKGVQNTSTSAHSTDPLRDWYTTPRVCTQGREGMPGRESIQHPSATESMHNSQKRAHEQTTRAYRRGGARHGSRVMGED